MKQILQSLRTGATEVGEVPAPAVGRGQLCIHTRASLVSAGTERMLVEFGKANWLDRARQQPDKVRMVLEKVRTDGLMATWESVQSKLDEPLALGYCNVGTVAAVGTGVAGFAVGERVVSNGCHAEVVCVPHKLCARIPDSVSDEQAAFTVLGAIALQGIRLVQPTLGECVVVTGLGLIGLLTVQLLRAQGCRVMGIDPDAQKLALATQFGAEMVISPAVEPDVLSAAQSFSRGRGVDAVLIAASTQSSGPVSQAARMCRKRGRIVLIGVTGLELSRADFYEKELSFQVSCSYGPGRYDPAYEEAGHDYPVGFVRWTEQRNFEAVLDMMAAGRLDLAPLISHRFPIESAVEAYELLASDAPSLGMILTYRSDDVRVLERQTVQLAARAAPQGKGVVAFLGAGNYASRVLMPAFRRAGAALHTAVSARGVSSAHFGRKFGFAAASTDWLAAVTDTAVDTVVVATRHDAHARQVLAALRAGKHVFCEKPLCLTLEELAEIERAATAPAAPLLMVGFNRRFAPLTVRLKQRLAAIREPKSFVLTVNAGAIPVDHWTQDLAVGGGRIVGEACHFIDLLRHLAGAPIHSWQRVVMDAPTADTLSIQLGFGDGSIGALHYLANGARNFPKERLEVFAAGRILRLDNFRRLTGYGWPGISTVTLWRQDKGVQPCVNEFLAGIRRGDRSPIPIDEVIEVARLSIEMQGAR